MEPPVLILSQFATTWPLIFAVDLAKYFVFAGSVAAALGLFASVLAHRRIQPVEPRLAQIRREIGYSVLTALLFSLVGFFVLFGTEAGVLQVYRGPVPGVARFLIEIAALIVLHDTWFYWIHRALHHRKLFRRAHLLHHRSKTPTPWTSYCFAPPEAIAQAAFLPVAVALIPAHYVTVELFVLHMLLRNVISHAGFELFPKWWLKVPMLRTVVTTTHHDLHHSGSAHNFGLYFTLWDRLMKTEHPHYRARFEVATRWAENESD